MTHRNKIMLHHGQSDRNETHTLIGSVGSVAVIHFTALVAKWLTAGMKSSKLSAGDPDVSVSHSCLET